MRLGWDGTTTGGRRLAFASSHRVAVDRSGLISELVDFFYEKGHERQLGI